MERNQEQRRDDAREGKDRRASDFVVVATSVPLWTKTAYALAVTVAAVFLATTFGWITYENSGLDRYPAIKWIVERFNLLHWAVKAAGGAVLYPLYCYFTDCFFTWPGAATGRTPTWSQLRSFGDRRIARISYGALALIPLGAFIIVDNPFGFEILRNITLPLNIKLAFFSSFFFSIALLLFTLACPAEFRRKEAGKQLDRADLGTDLLRLEARAITFLFYVLGFLFASAVMIRAAYYVAVA